MDENYKIYIKVDGGNNLIEINSDAFIPETTGYMQIDEGTGDKYHHAQNHYLEKPLIDEYGRYNYQYIDGKIVEIADEDKPPIPIPEPTAEERLEALELAMLEVILDG